MTFANLEKSLFTYEKVFKLQAPKNKQNDRIDGVNLSDISKKRHSEKKFPVNIMVSPGVFKLGKTSIHLLSQVQR